MEKVKSIRGRVGPARSTATRVFALLLVICLAESATGSCLSYGHSCWGAHGKRSGRPPVSASDWYLTRMLRRMTTDTELTRPRHNNMDNNDDISAIFQIEVPDNSAATNRANADNEDNLIDPAGSRNLEAKPMLDDELLAKIKIWQMMREAAQKK